jgi:hypothetical protein
MLRLFLIVVSLTESRALEIIAVPKRCAAAHRGGPDQQGQGAIPLSVPLQKDVSDERKFDASMSERLAFVTSRDRRDFPGQRAAPGEARFVAERSPQLIRCISTHGASPSCHVAN